MDTLDIEIPPTDTRSEIVKKADELTACPACNHPARQHWPSKGGVFTTATTREQQLYIRHRDYKINKQATYKYSDNSHPGNLPMKGCFRLVSEYWHREGDIAYNKEKFCDCPIDQETVLALIQRAAKN